MSDATIHAALAVPARRRLLEALRAADRALTAGDIAQKIDLHVTTVRFHLDQLEQAGLVSREVHHESRRGRPSVRYVAVSSDDDARDQMIVALADMLAAQGATTTAGETASTYGAAEKLGSPDQPNVSTNQTWETRSTGPITAGLQWAQSLHQPGGPAPAKAPLQAVATEFSRMGFDPLITGSTIELHSCPFREAAQRHPGIVCKVHLGLAQGLAARTPGGESMRVGLAPFVEPDPCLLTFHQESQGELRSEPPLER